MTQTPTPAEGPVSAPRFTAELITGGDQQCPHGFPRGHWIRPDTQTPACAMCRRRYLRQQGATITTAEPITRDPAAAEFGHHLIDQWKRNRTASTR